MKGKEINPHDIALMRGVLRKIEKDHGYGFMMNFHGNLPNGIKRKMVEISGIMDVPFGELFNRDNSVYELKNTSKLKKGKTPRQFFSVVDETISEVGIPLQMILDLQTRLASNPNGIIHDDLEVTVKQGIINELYQLTMPLYVALRIKGFSEYDLTI